MIGIIAVNGKITDADKAQIPALDRGFLFGDSVFEVLLTEGKSILDADEHLERLRLSAQQIALELPWKNEELFAEMKDLVLLKEYQRGYLRLVITRGEGLGLKIPETHCHKVLYYLPAPEENPSIYTEGIKVLTQKSLNKQRGALPKTSNYLQSIVALQAVQKLGYDDVLWHNEKDEFTEATTANVFFVFYEDKHPTVITPTTECGLLKGITREKILNLLRTEKITCQETFVSISMLANVKEAFLSSTIKGLVPISTIDNFKLKTCEKNSLFNRIKRCG